MRNSQKIKNVFSKEKKLIAVKDWREIVFVGDTHGDLEASKRVITNYLGQETIIVFLGDYVDRGPASRENIEFLFEQKCRFPQNLYLLAGNHEGYSYLPFSPSDFWQSLSREEFENYQSVFEKLPLVFMADNLLALHGALPDLENLAAVNRIKSGDRAWWQITWGDFWQGKGGYLGENPLSGRPLFGSDWFFNLMNRFQKRVLIRSHQPDASLWMFNQKCLTIFTSSAYARERNIAVARKDKIEIIRI